MTSAAWRILGSYFNVGDFITYGKYQNHKGRILQFTKDEKGYPAVLVEPVPKGSKHNKVITLFKIRRVDQEKTAMSIRNVVARYKQAFGGWTVVVGDIRIQRWNHAIRVWDLTNAGKRGKKVDVLDIVSERNLPFQEEQDFIGRIYERIQAYDTLSEVWASIKDYMDEFPDSLKMSKSQERGIDVQPAGSTSLRLTTSTGCTITATPLEWHLTHTSEFVGPKGNKFTQDTIYSSKDKKSAKLFYNWLLGNTKEISRMTIQDFQALWNSIGAKFTTY